MIVLNPGDASGRCHTAAGKTGLSGGTSALKSKGMIHAASGTSVDVMQKSSARQLAQSGFQHVNMV